MDRSDQHKAIKSLDKLVAVMPEFESSVRQILMRGRFSSGQRFHRKGELGDMEGSPGPYSSDPTGEEACWEELADATGKKIQTLAETISNALAAADSILNFSSTDVAERAKRSVPDCKACGKPVEGRIISLYDRSCYDKWVYYRKTHKNADKYQFELEIRQALEDENVTDESFPTP